MLDKYVKILVLVATGFILFYTLYYLRDMGCYEDPVFPYTVTSLPYDQIQPLLLEKIDYVKQNSGPFNPYSSSRMDLVRNTVAANANVRQNLLACTIALPNSGLHMYPLAPLTDPNVVTWRFCQGQAGWHFFYGTFYDPASASSASYFVYIMHLDLLPPSLLKKHSLQPGEASYYNVAAGVGINGVWEHTPQIVCRGTYQASSISTFNFAALDFPGILTWSSPLFGQFKVVCSWTNAAGQPYSINASLQAVRPPFLNSSPGGCTPCIMGLGTLYVSLTQLRTSADLAMNSTAPTAFAGGTGWIDHQWYNGQANQFPMKILYALSGARGGLGKYLWLNLHVSDQLQYMLSVNPGDAPIRVGMKLPTRIQGVRYAGNSRVGYDVPFDLTVTAVTTVNGTIFPTAYAIQVDGLTYTLDGHAFGTTVTTDLYGNDHWTGSGLLTDDHGNLIGTGFLEANQLQPDQEYNIITWKSCGIDATDPASYKAMASSPSFAALWPIYLLALAVLAVVVLSIYFVYKVLKYE